MVHDRIKLANANVIKFNNKNNLVVVIRLIVFFLFLYSIYSTFSHYNNQNLFFVFLLFLVFLFLFSISFKINEIINFNKNILKVCAEIINEKSDEKILSIIETHPYADDLDIFGKKSLFEKLDRTQTIFGTKKLTTFLQIPIQDFDEIVKRQDAVKELSNKINWCIDFLAIEKLIKGKVRTENIICFKNEGFDKLNTRLFRNILIIIPIFNMLVLIFSLISGFSFFTIITLIISLLISIVLNYIYSKPIDNVYSNIELNTNELKIYSSIFLSIENENFLSILNTELKNNFFTSKSNASIFIKKLSYLIDQYENRKAFIVGAILNVFVLWNLQFAFKIGKHIQDSKNEISNWFDALGEFEALISFGLFAYKNSEYTYPILSEKFDVTNISHPLLPKEQRVNNNFTLKSKNNQVVIITGANMTGKSTFLRTIGVNLVLAMNGCPVCAMSFSFYPIQLFTSMRTNDSLADGSSYFNAEIKRLKLLIDKLEDNKPQFIILDEILKGTNSEDKLKGSKLFLKKIIKMKTQVSCIIATHDLDLTKMHQEYPNNIENYCFELYDINAELEPDYKLQKGITQSMNAIRLMRKYKIIN